VYDLHNNNNNNIGDRAGRPYELTLLVSTVLLVKVYDGRRDVRCHCHNYYEMSSRRSECKAGLSSRTSLLPSTDACSEERQFVYIQTDFVADAIKQADRRRARAIIPGLKESPLRCP